MNSINARYPTYEVLEKIHTDDIEIIEIKEGKYAQHRTLTTWEKIWDFLFGIDNGLNKLLEFICSPEGKTHLENTVKEMKNFDKDLNEVANIINTLRQKITFYNEQADLKNKCLLRKLGIQQAISTLSQIPFEVKQDSADTQTHILHDVPL